jgi:hypothetical protein
VLVVSIQVIPWPFGSFTPHGWQVTQVNPLAA